MAQRRAISCLAAFRVLQLRSSAPRGEGGRTWRRLRTIVSSAISYPSHFFELQLPRKAAQPTIGAATSADDTGGNAARMPASLVRLSNSALIATKAELPDMDSAAISGLKVKG